MNSNSLFNQLVLLNDATHNMLQGSVEKLDGERIIGWVRFKDKPTDVVCFDVFVDQVKICKVVANLSAEDVGLSKDNGQCAFEIPVSQKYLSAKKHVFELKECNSQETIPGSPFNLGPGFFDFDLAVVDGSVAQVSFQQRTRHDHAFQVRLNLDQENFFSAHYCGGEKVHLELALPAKARDSKKHQLTFQILDKNGKVSVVSNRQIQHQYEGRIESVSFEKIRGWVSNKTFPKQAVDIELYINGKTFQSTQCNQPRPDLNKVLATPHPEVGFEIFFPKTLAFNTSTSIEVFIKGTQTRLLNKQYVLTPKDIIIRSLLSASEWLNSRDDEQGNITLSGGVSAEVNANLLVRQQIIAPIVQQLREQKGLSPKLKLAIKPVAELAANNYSTRINVIIPVYQGYAQTLACIESVVKSQNLGEFELIVVNDASPDGRLKYKLRQLSQQHAFTLIENETNSGFVASVNKAMQLHLDRDVVLLNSDTEVYGNWLDRLRAAAFQDSAIGTVTPFSNNASICSFPKIDLENELPFGIEYEQLDQCFSRINHQQLQQIPTAVGFCMFIKRELLDIIGYFDAKLWGKGYAEENDFCLKASNFGWKHVLATDVFVYHHGSVSFAESRETRINQNLTILDKMYPDYHATIQRFLRQDPIAKHRNPVIKKIIRKQADKFILFVMHDLGGGAQTHSDEMAALLSQQGYAVLELVANHSSSWHLSLQDSPYLIKYDYPESMSSLIDDLLDLNIWRVHLHQVVSFSVELWDLIKAIGCDYDYSAHDFLAICPRINMIDESGRFCENARLNVDKCQRCIQINGLPEGIGIESLWQAHGKSVEKWRQSFKEKLLDADTVFCPSNSTARIYKQHFSLKNIRTKRHPEHSFTINYACKDVQQLNIAIIGAIGPHKGSQLLLDCAKNALKEGLPLHFHLIGYSNIDEQLMALENVTVSGEYKSQESLQQLILSNQCQVALFLSVWPETFCYTLTEALRNHLYPIALNYGAIAERIKGLGFGTLLNANSSAKDINKKLIQLKSELINHNGTIDYAGSSYPDILTDYYELKNDQ